MTGPAVLLRNARRESVPAARNAYTANRMTSAPTVMFGQATEITPIATASIPRHSSEDDRDENMQRPPSALKSVADADAVVDGGDPGSGPRRRHRGVVFRPRAHASGQRRGAVHGFHTDVVGLDLGVPLHGLLDRVRDVVGAGGGA